MFTGIVETIGKIVSLRTHNSNLDITLESSFTQELKIDQSVAHNGVCLTVVTIENNRYTVTAIDETLQKSNLGGFSEGDLVNLERAIKLGDRLDGHMVQGHIDQIATCVAMEEANGSWVFTFEYDPSLENLTIEKGSITVNGVSLTVVNSKKGVFSVAIIPYTFQNTNFKTLSIGSVVNLEFDLIGKYVNEIMKRFR